MPSSSWTVLAHLFRPQGRKGEILAELLTDFPESLEGRADLLLVPSSGSSPQAREVKVLSSWLPVGRNRGRVVLAIEGVNSISEAESLAGMDLVVADEARETLPEDSVYVSDLVGCAVFDGEQNVGVVTGVQFPSSPTGDRLEDAPSLLEIDDSEGNELLVPFAKEFVVSIDAAAKRIVMRLPAGLIDINR